MLRPEYDKVAAQGWSCSLGFEVWLTMKKQCKQNSLICFHLIIYEQVYTNAMLLDQQQLTSTNHCIGTKCSCHPRPFRVF